MQALDSWWLRTWCWTLSWDGARKLGWSRRAVCIWCGGSLNVGECPQDLRFDCNILPEYPGSRVIALTISGFYPPGNAGNKHASVMAEWVADRICEIQPAAVLFDLTGLDYVLGDPMLRIADPLYRGISAAYLATGRTAGALESLFDVFRPDWEEEKPQIFEDRGEALRYLEDQMNRIHYAASNGNLAKIKMLLKDNPALVASKDARGMTSLHWAAKYVRKHVMELLLANNADVNTKDNNGETPLRVAGQEGRKDVMELLRRHGGHK